MAAALPVTAYSIANALGSDTQAVLGALRRAESGLRPAPLQLPFTTLCGALPDALPELPDSLAQYDTREARIVAALVASLAGPLAAARARWGGDRIGIALGTSTAGLAETENAFAVFQRQGRPPDGYSFAKQHVPDALLALIRSLGGGTGPAVVVSTACSSSAKVFGVARRWIAMGLCDAVLVGGVDTLCQTTLRGFHALELLAETACRPFALGRSGLNIGEGGAFALLEREGDGPTRLLGVGETSDAHHMTAPHPEGLGALAAMREALAQGGLSPADVGHVNAHGTGTQLNDAAEAQAIGALFGDRVPVASTKGYTGHLLGAAGATEAIFAIAALEHGFLPQSLGCETPDPALGLLLLRAPLERQVQAVLSNSFAFGGNNVCLAFGRAP